MTEWRQDKEMINTKGNWSLHLNKKILIANSIDVINKEHKIESNWIQFIKKYIATIYTKILLQHAKQVYYFIWQSMTKL